MVKTITVFIITFFSLIPVFLFGQYDPFGNSYIGHKHTRLTDLLTSPTISNGVDTMWVRRYNGPGDTIDVAHRVAVDLSGNVYVAGTSVGSGTGKDFAVLKYNSLGTEQWVRRYDGPANDLDSLTSMAVDDVGNVYICGVSTGTGTSSDYATIKFNPAGDTLWVRRYDGPGNRYDGATAIAVGRTGNVYVTGYSYGGTATGTNYATIKYNPTGDTLWVRRYNPQDNFIDVPTAIALDSLENVYVTGRAAEGLTGGTFFATVKYNSAGVEQWAKEYGQGYDEAVAIAVNDSGNVFVTGYSYDYSGQRHLLDYLTIKYNATGVQQWVRRYNGPGDGHDGATAIAMDGVGDIYVTGWSLGNGTNFDFATVKYNQAGDTLWLRRYDGPGMGPDWGTALVIDRANNIYVTGLSVEGNLTQDYTTIKYDSAGDTVWRQTYDGPGNGHDIAFSIALDDSDYVYVTGGSPGTNWDLDFATIKYSQVLTGIEERLTLNAKRSELEIFPNPTKTDIRLQMTDGRCKNIYLKIYDVCGKLVREEELRGFKGEARISLKGISAGVYFIKAEIEGKEFIEKLVVTK